MFLDSLSQSQAASLLSIAPRTLRDWTDAPRNPDGTYPGPGLVAYAIRKLTGSDLDLNKERARLAKEQADRTALSNAIARGDVIPSSQAVTQWGNHITAARAKWLSIPTTVAAQVASLTDVNTIAELIRGIVYAGLDELSRWTPDEGGPPVEVAAETDDQPVGRPRKKAVQRKQRRTGPVAN